MSDTDTDTKSRQWHEVANVDDIWEGEMLAVDVEGTSVLLVNNDDDIVAYRNQCPHQEWALDDGDLDGNKLTCAQHLWEFDVCTSKGINPTTHSLTPYACKVDDDSGAIWVSLQ